MQLKNFSLRESLYFDKFSQILLTFKKIIAYFEISPIKKVSFVRKVHVSKIRLEFCRFSVN